LLTILFPLHAAKPVKIAHGTGVYEPRKPIIHLNMTSQVVTFPRPAVEIQANVTLEEVRVNMAEMKVESKPVELVASVGSCVALCIHDSKNKCGGMAHVMLPKSSIAMQEPLPAKFADTAVPALAKAVRAVSGSGASLYAKIAGGANMFPNMNTLNIGAKNIEAIKAALAANKITLMGEDVGGSHGRRITFNITTGVATVRRFNGATTKL